MPTNECHDLTRLTPVELYYWLETVPLSNPESVAEPADCLGPTDVIDCDHPLVRETAARVTAGLVDEFDRAEAVFNFARDALSYNFTPTLLSRADWLASSTLARGYGFCQQKAVALAALARAAGIPSQIAFQHAIDYKLLNTRYESLLPEGLLAFHGLTVLWLNGAWRLADATLDGALVSRRGYRLVELRPDGDALLPLTDLAGEPHFKFLESFGPFPDLPVSISDTFITLRPWWVAWKQVVDRTGATM